MGENEHQVKVTQPDKFWDATDTLQYEEPKTFTLNVTKPVTVDGISSVTVRYPVGTSLAIVAESLRRALERMEKMK